MAHCFQLVILVHVQLLFGRSETVEICSDEQDCETVLLQVQQAMNPAKSRHSENQRRLYDDVDHSHHRPIAPPEHGGRHIQEQQATEDAEELTGWQNYAYPGGPAIPRNSYSSYYHPRYGSFRGPWAQGYGRFWSGKGSVEENCMKVCKDGETKGHRKECKWLCQRPPKVEVAMPKGKAHQKAEEEEKKVQAKEATDVAKDAAGQPGSTKDTGQVANFEEGMNEEQKHLQPTWHAEEHVISGYLSPKAAEDGTGFKRSLARAAWNAASNKGG